MYIKLIAFIFISSFIYGSLLAKDSLTVVFVHGLSATNRDNTSKQFCLNFTEFMQEKEVPLNLIKFNWKSPKMLSSVAPARYLKGKKLSENELSDRFVTEILEKFESADKDYYLTAHSMGTYIVIKALEKYTSGKLEHLKGIIFLGSAIRKDYQLQNNPLPQNFKIKNYYSPFWDQTINFVYNMEECEGAGDSGFDDETTFTNYRTACTHAYKGIGIHRDYSTIADAIGFVILHQENYFLPGKNYFLRQTTVFNETINWNDILTIKTTQKEYLVQKFFSKNGDYRIILKGDKNINLIQGKDLLSMLRELNLF